MFALRYVCKNVVFKCGLGAVHTSQLDQSEIELIEKRSEYERLNAN